MNLSEVDAHLQEIKEMYGDESYFHRMKKLFSGLKAPRSSRQYKESMIEIQRLSAPISAIVLPALTVVLLVFLSNASTTDERIIETQIMEAEEMKELEEIEELEKPPDEMQEMDIDVPVDSPDVNVENVEDTPLSPQPQEFDAVMNVKSPVILKNIYGSTRNTGTRGASLARFGGDKQTEDAVMRALRWLKKNQNKDGSWNSKKVAMTGLGILTFLAHGDKPGDSAEFGETIQKALEYLLKVQKSNGLLPGNYDHPIATYALCEAYGMTLNPNVKEAAEKALAAVIKGQHPTGGWTYNLFAGVDKKTGKYRDDTSYMGWCAQALKAGKLAKLHVDGQAKAIKLAIKGFKANAAPNGGFGYCSPGASGLTSVGTLCMQLLGAGSDPAVRKSQDIMDNWSIGDYTLANKVGGSPQYYFYYATQAKFHAGGKRWTNWNKAMKPIYIKAQKIQKNAIKDAKGKDQDIGWWENVDRHTDRPVMDTCLTALQLMVYYRYLPTTSKAAVQVEVEIEAKSTDTDDITVDVGNL
ncbi:MAG: terpene cyclase/mutase family protein [Kiritimatiellae bacterium]|jgi:hypothetical protein|nr:terpene cyclase/mutase family protein [Kiritimatiellia bacterium]